MDHHLVGQHPGVPCLRQSEQTVLSGRLVTGSCIRFDRALEDVGLAEDETLGRVLHEYFAWATTNMAM